MIRFLRRLLLIIFLVLLFAGTAALGISFYMQAVTYSRILSPESGNEADLSEIRGFFGETQADCILVLGCGVKSDGTPSSMLEDRLQIAVSLYRAGAAPKILMSGDHGSIYYDEVHTMKDYAMAEGVPEEDIFLDHAGFSTYESMYRASAIFEVKSAIVVTQKYHLYRALYAAEKMGIRACGMSADLRKYAGQTMREIREVFARDKDFFQLIFRPEPSYLGETIPVSGDGRASDT